MLTAKGPPLVWNKTSTENSLAKCVAPFTAEPKAYSADKPCVFAEETNIPRTVSLAYSMQSVFGGCRL